jgi:hypothetical protein
MLKSRTHFEQIPLDEVVKKIVEGDVSKDEKAETDNVIVEPAARTSKPQSLPARSLQRKRR